MSVAMRAVPHSSRQGKAPETSVRLDAAGEDPLTHLITPVDQWITEEEWLAGFPGNRNEHFGRWWWVLGSLNE